MAIFTVTNTNDAGEGSLRQAVLNANGSSNADTIVFAAELAGQTIALTSGELVLSNDVTIDGDVNGDDKADITISGSDNDRIFKVFDQNTPSTDVDLKSLTLTNGSARGYSFNQDDDGGAIYMRGKSLDIVDCTIKDSAANYGGGGLDIQTGAVRIVNSLFTGNSAGSYGGAIRNFSGDSLSLTNSTLSGNTSAGAGGILDLSYGTLRLDSSTVVNNTGGSGITTGYGTTTINNSVVAGNGLGGAAANNDIGGTVTTANHSFFGTTETITTNIGSINGGGNPLLGTLTDNGGTVLTHAPLGGSALIDAGNNAVLPKDPFDIDGDANKTETLPEDGRGETRVINGTTDIGAVEFQLQVSTANDEAFGGGTLAAESADGGGLSLREALAFANANANADHITFAANLAGQTLVLTRGQLSITQDVTIDGDTDGDHKADITISGNNASGIFAVTAGNTDLLSLTLVNGRSERGGAIDVTGGSLDLVNSTLSGNSATFRGGALAFSNATVRINNSLITGNTSDSSAGAIYGFGSSGFAVINSTLHANSAYGFGGAIYLSNVTGTVSSSTITGNAAGSSTSSTTRGGGFSISSSSIGINNSVVGENTSGYSGALNDVSSFGYFASANNNAFSTGAVANGVGGNQSNVANLGLGQLLDNGGTTLTRSPLDGSVLIGAGNNVSVGLDKFDLDDDGDTLEALPLDGRGGVRVVGGTVDVGAVEQIVNETIRGTETANTILGGLGIDKLFGLGGADSLNGGAGRDTMEGGDGSDTYFADLFNDVVRETNTVLATGGNDHVIFNGVAGTFTLGLNVERLTLRGAAAINGKGNGLDNNLTGNGAANTLSGLGGSDRINGGAGRDIMQGGDGNDTYFADLFNDVVKETNIVLATGGNDLVNFNGVAGTFTLGLNVERLTLRGAAAINGKGNDLDNILIGNGTANRLTGGLGADLLTGGAGADLFDFNAITESTVAAGGRDTITDFNGAATDRIDLSTIDADSVLGGNNVFTFIGAATFTGLGQVRAFTSGANTIVDINTTGSNAADLRILLTGLHTLDPADFIL